MILGVQHLVRDARRIEIVAHELVVLDRDRADEHWLALLVELFDPLGHCAILPGRSLEDEIIKVFSRRGPVRRDDDHIEPIDGEKFFLARERGTGHARDLLVHAEIILERDRGIGACLFFYQYAFFCFNRLVQTFAPTATGLHTAREFVNNHNLTILHDVLFILVEECRGAHRGLEVMRIFDTAFGVEIFHPEGLFGFLHPRFGYLDGFLLLVDRIILILTKTMYDLRKLLIEIPQSPAGPLMMSGVRASSIKIESISSTMA